MAAYRANRYLFLMALIRQLLNIVTQVNMPVILRNPHGFRSGSGTRIMPKKIYNKLVRDKIPEIIKADGKTAKFHILNNEDYLEELIKKLNEEYEEFKA